MGTPANPARHAAVLLSLGLTAAVMAQSPESREMEGFEAIDDLFVVDCLLPGEVRQMGRMTYLSPRIPIRTTAVDCRIRGGEYTAYSRADYRSALRVWQGRADEGDAEAQYMVGEIHEKGLGTEPDYAEAARWYRLAADQGHSRAMMSLAYFHEQGLGVEQDPVAALNWYRRASGLEENDLMFAAVARQRLDEQARALEGELTQARQEQDVLRGQVERLREELTAQAEQAAGASETIATLERLLVEASERVDDRSRQLAQIRGSQAELPSPEAIEPVPPELSRGRFSFGRYYALIVGLERYEHWDQLQSPHNDARRLAEILNQRYGFDTTLLLDASTREILSAINDLRERSSPEDNVLIYFAGHGQLLRADDAERRRGYWLPVNAETDRTTYWVPNSAINDHLALIDARSILVVADSCYGGAMSTDPASLLTGLDAPLSDALVELGLARPARYVLSSGGLHPVLDVGSGEHSVFARALIDVLESNEQLMREQDLFSAVSQRAEQISQQLPFAQRPELRPIRPAGHGAGSFFFVPRDFADSGD
ncbi:caspase family protein [Wenzhouxiangella marina]|uniref:TPR repeat, SEL1 subfamily protein n=1 Tax=Wenzhouxiangella marina TaxID=1579979 RepID=A0A0K0XVS0_9GAMM|nr:caspase family protein [Wenzhouxiangella marina]AKS41783.1 TPR repeat, SEL1 subfamily protein [Wenzhouxiangella marina]MBB6086455.1 TPR repeat protein [Wenzhouxiangella marina]